MHMATAAIYRSLLSNVTCYPSIPGILQNIPCVTSGPSISGAIFDVAERFLDLETWENSLPHSRRPVEFMVIESEQFSLRHGLSSRMKIYRGGERDLLRTGPTADIATECFYLAFVADDDFYKSKMKEKTPAEGKSGQEIKIANRDWNFQRQPSMILPFMCSAQKRGTSRNPTDTAVNSIFHSCKMAYSAIYEILNEIGNSICIRTTHMNTEQFVQNFFFVFLIIGNVLNEFRINAT